MKKLLLVLVFALIIQTVIAEKDVLTLAASLNEGLGYRGTEIKAFESKMDVLAKLHQRLLQQEEEFVAAKPEPKIVRESKTIRRKRIPVPTLYSEVTSGASVPIPPKTGYLIRRATPRSKSTIYYAPQTQNLPRRTLKL